MQSCIRTRSSTLPIGSAKTQRPPATIPALIADARRNPFTGLRKPEPLRGNYKGWWSSRITDEHRLVYRVAGLLVRP